MSIKNALEARWMEVLQWVQSDNLAELRDFINCNSPTKFNNELHKRRLNDLLRAAANRDCENCVQYLAQELGGDIHHVEHNQTATTLVLAIYCKDKKRRAGMFKALMGLADSNTLDERAPEWTRALRATLLIGDDEIFGDLAAFIGPRRLSEWLDCISDPDGDDAWRLAALGGNIKMASILLAIPAMRARFDEARSPSGHDLANFAHDAGQFDFARDLLCLVAAERDQEALENACPAAKAGRGPNGRI